MKILVIDDDPARCDLLIKMGHEVVLAHTPDQIRYWTMADYWLGDDFEPFGLVCLDHDLGTIDRDVAIANTDGTAEPEARRASCVIDMDGMWVCEFVRNWTRWPIWIWSWNPPGALAMEGYLRAQGCHRVVRQEWDQDPVKAREAMGRLGLSTR